MEDDFLVDLEISIEKAKSIAEFLYYEFGIDEVELSEKSLTNMRMKHKQLSSMYNIILDYLVMAEDKIREHGKE